MDPLFYLLPLTMIGIGYGSAFLLRLLLMPLRLPEHTVSAVCFWFGLLCAVVAPVLIGSLPRHKKSQRELISEAKVSNGHSRQIMARVIDEIIKDQSYINGRHLSDGNSLAVAPINTAQARRLKTRLSRCSIQKEDNFSPVLLTCLHATKGFLSAVERGEQNVAEMPWEEAIQILRYIRLRLSSYTNDQPIDDPRVRRMAKSSVTV